MSDGGAEWVELVAQPDPVVLQLPCVAASPRSQILLNKEETVTTRSLSGGSVAHLDSCYSCMLSIIKLNLNCLQ